MKMQSFLKINDFTNYAVFPSYQPVSQLYKVKNVGIILFVVGGGDGAFIYVIEDKDLSLKKHLSKEDGVFKITDSRDIDVYEKDLLVLDYKAGILFFSLEDFSYQGTFISFLFGERFTHQNMDVIYVAGRDSLNRYFLYEILYVKENKSFMFNRKSDEQLPTKHIEIFGDYVFILTGETLKIYFHSIPAEWVPYKYNIVNYVVEKDIINFFPVRKGSFDVLFGVSQHKIDIYHVNEIMPKIICEYGKIHHSNYSYIINGVSKNCPEKIAHNESPYYSMCTFRQSVFVSISSKFHLMLYDRIVLIVLVLVSVALIAVIALAFYFFYRNKTKVNVMQVEMENLKKKFKYQEIVEEKGSREEVEEKGSREEDKDLGQL